MSNSMRIMGVSVKGAHNHLNFSANLGEETTIVFGDNGSGKTTLLHILANILNRDYARFREIPFKEIAIWFDQAELTIRRTVGGSFSDEATGQIEFSLGDTRFLILESAGPPELLPNQSLSHEKVLSYNLPSCLYIPAFRSVIDSWKSNLSPIPNQVIDAFMRKWGNPFWPNTNFPSLGEIESELRQRSKTPMAKDFIALVNQFLRNKNIELSLKDDQSPVIEIVYSNSGVRSRGIGALSSGERQLVTMLFATSELSGKGVILIDEPEISLDATWQRRLVDEMRRQIGERQLIICTHSPMIGGSHLDHVISMSDKPLESLHNRDIPY